MRLEISRQAFWDIRFEDIKGNEKRYANWIIKRVAQYGTVDDMASVDAFYGRDKIKEAINEMSEAEKSRARLMIFFVS